MNRVERILTRFLNPPKRHLTDDVDRLITWINMNPLKFFLTMAAALFIVHLLGF